MVGRNRAQFGSFLLGGICLMACALGTLDSIFVMTMAIIARMCSLGRGSWRFWRFLKWSMLEKCPGEILWLICLILCKISFLHRNFCCDWWLKHLLVISNPAIFFWGLSVVFVTIYVALADIFPEWCQKIALPTCEIFARDAWRFPSRKDHRLWKNYRSFWYKSIGSIGFPYVCYLFFRGIFEKGYPTDLQKKVGGCLSPSCGTLPVHLSCPLFGLACLAAARATMKLPEKCRHLKCHSETTGAAVDLDFLDLDRMMGA